MRLEIKFRILGCFFFLLTNQLRFIESAESTNEETKGIISSYGFSYISIIANDQLEKAIESSFGIISEQNKYNSKYLSIWQRFDAETDIITDIVNSEGKFIVTKLNNTESYPRLEKIGQAVKTLLQFKNYYNNNFIPCIVKKECREETRKTYFTNWLGIIYSNDRKNFHDLIKYSAVKYSHKINVFDIILSAWKNEEGNHNPEWIPTASVQNSIYNFYKFVRNIVIQIYRMILYLGEEQYLEAKRHQWPNMTDALNQVNDLRNKFKNDLIAISRTAQDTLNEASRDIRPLDPEVHKKGITYISLTRFISAVLIKSGNIKKNLDTDRFYDGREKLTTPYFSKRENYQQNPYDTWTGGPLINCTTDFFHSVYPIYIDEKNPERIYYRWNAENSDGETHWYGKEGIAHSGELRKYEFQDDRNFFMRLFIGSKNSFDLCWVDYSRADEISIRKFSALPVSASSGKVVTGIRWRLRNNIIYPQIREGKMVNGSIKFESVNWKEIVEVKNPRDYIVLDLNLRSFNLDDIILPEGSFVTGFQFETTNNEKAITFSLFSGKISDDGFISHLSQKINITETSGRQEIMLNRPDVSEDAPHSIKHQIEGEPGKHYVRFQPADLIKDGGQTTVPYLDSQEIVTTPPAPISGIGTYFKKIDGYGGFVGLKLISVDVITMLKNEDIGRIFEEIQEKRTEIYSEEESSFLSE